MPACRFVGGNVKFEAVGCCFPIELFPTVAAVIQGAFCPCVLFGKNVEAIKDEIPYRAACVCHAVVVEGGVAAASVLSCFTGSIDPGTCCLIWECLLLTWWMCGIYTGLFRQELQRKYHLQVRNAR